MHTFILVCLKSSFLEEHYKILSFISLSKICDFILIDFEDTFLSVNTMPTLQLIVFQMRNTTLDPIWNYHTLLHENVSTCWSWNATQTLRLFSTNNARCLSFSSRSNRRIDVCRCRKFFTRGWNTITIHCTFNRSLSVSKAASSV